jgi:hypothetical protein
VSNVHKKKAFFRDLKKRTENEKKKYKNVKSGAEINK